MRKHFLLFFLMSLLPLAGWAADLDESKFTAANIEYGTAVLPAVSNTQALVEDTHYEVDDDYFYTSDEGAGQTAVANLATATASTKYYLKVTGIGDYVGQTIYVSFWINQKPVTIDFAAGLTKTYGGDDPAFTYTLTKDGAAWDGTETLGLTVGRDAGEDVDDYDYTFEWTNTNYALTRVGGDADQFSITALALAADDVTITSYADQVYKGASYVPTYTVKYGAEDISSSTTVGVYSNDERTVEADPKAVGTYYVKLTFGGNYSGTVSTQSFQITKAPMSVQIGNASKTYKGENYAVAQIGDVTMTYLGFLGEDVGDDEPAGLTAWTLAIPATAKDAGDYAITATDAEATNYSLTVITNGTFTITPAELTLTADDKNKTVGAADPELTYTVTGLKGTDVEDDVITTAPTLTREEGEDVDDYEITISGGATNSNYTIADHVAGTFTINAGTLTITVLNQEKTFGEADPTTLASPVKGTHYIITGAAEDDDVVVTALTRTEGETAGSYSINATYTYDEDNYTGVTVVPGTFTINKAPLNIKVMAQTLAIGDGEEDLNQDANAYTITGLTKAYGADATDTADDVLEALVFSDGTGEGENEPDMDNADTYVKAIVPELTTYGAANYALTYTAGNLIVSGAAELVLDRNATDLVTTLTDNDGEVVNVTFINERTLKAQKWYSMVLPFDITVADLSTTLGYALVNRLNQTISDGNVHFSLAWGTIPANEPFLLKVQGTDNGDGTFDAIDLNTIQFANVEITAPDAATVTLSHDGIEFVGLYVKTALAQGDKFYAGTDSDKPYAVGSNATNLGAFASYWTAPATARVFVEDIEGNTTVIKEVSVQTLNEMGTEGWYNLRGMKQQAAPTEKGVYIKDGKKFVIK